LSGLVQVSLSLDKGMFAGIEGRAKIMGKRPNDYIRNLIEGAYAARVGREKKMPATDRDLDDAVRAVFCLAGEFSVPVIAKATGFSEELVRDVLKGFRIVAEEPRQPRALPAPETAAGVDKTVRTPPEVGAAYGFTPKQQDTIVRMWGEGSSSSAIASEVDADMYQVRDFVAKNRDLCPARPIDGDKGIKPQPPAEAATPLPPPGAAGEEQKRDPHRERAWPAEMVEKVRVMWAAGSSSSEIDRGDRQDQRRCRPVRVPQPRHLPEAKG
jgi:hypothetical protein